MSCIAFPNLFSRIGNSCLQTFGMKRKPPQPLEISAPFNFQEGPAVNFQKFGYSEDDISLMREKAIASTAIVEDGEFHLGSRIQRPRSRASSHTCGLGSRVAYHARRVSKSYLPTVV